MRETGSNRRDLLQPPELTTVIPILRSGIKVVMSESYIRELLADRIGGRQYGKSNVIYKFEKIKRAKRAAIRQHPGKEIIDLGIGEPDDMAFPEVVEKLYEEARKPENRGYADNGGPVLKQAAARYLEQVFGVRNLNAETDIIHSIGSKSALSLLPTTLINAGDVVLMTAPGIQYSERTANIMGGRFTTCSSRRKTSFFRISMRCQPMCGTGPRCWFLITQTTQPAPVRRRNFMRGWSRSRAGTGWWSSRTPLTPP